jgi:hypothetical protein
MNDSQRATKKAKCQPYKIIIMQHEFTTNEMQVAREMLSAIIKFKNAAELILSLWEGQDSEFAAIFLNTQYPFSESFEEIKLSIDTWADNVKDNLLPAIRNGKLTD